MIEAEMMAAFAQFGVAGLIGWMWLSERRSSAERDRQIGYAHRKLKESQGDQGVLIEAMRESTRAMVALEAGQRALVSLIERETGPGEGLGRSQVGPNGMGAA